MQFGDYEYFHYKFLAQKVIKALKEEDYRKRETEAEKEAKEKKRSANKNWENHKVPE